MKDGPIPVQVLPPSASGWHSAAVELAVAAAIVVSIGLMYQPCLSQGYLFLDDYVLAVQADGTPQQAIVSDGRPALALIYTWFFDRPRRPAEYTFVRWIGAASVALQCYLVSRWLLRWRIGAAQRVAIGVVLAALPAQQLFVGWASCCAFSLASCLAIAAADLVDRAVDLRCRRPWPSWALLTGAVATMILALAIYQPAAMWFWPGWLTVLVPWPGQPFACTRRARKIWTALFVGCAAIGLYYVLLQLTPWLLDGPIGRRGQLCVDPLGKISWFLRKAAPRGFGLWISSRRYIWLSVPLMLAGLLALRLQEKFWRSQHGTTARQLWFGRIALLACFVLSYLPCLVVMENWPSFRSLSALSGLALLVAFWSVAALGLPLWNRWRGLDAALALVLAGFVGWQTHEHVWGDMVQPHLVEYSYLRDTLRSQLADGATHIHVVSPQYDETICSRISSDEFGQLSCSRTWIAPGMVRIALLDLGYTATEIGVSAAFVDTPPPAGSTVRVIDMCKLPGIHHVR